MLPDIFISIVNFIISAIGTLASSILNLLPNSPFASVKIQSISTNYLGHLAWIIPFETLITILSSSLIVVGTYYLYQIVLRWVKAIK